MPLIRVLDFETTGTEPPAEVCEVGWSDYDSETRLAQCPRWNLCSVPFMPPEVRAIHHITAAETQAELPWDAERWLLDAKQAGVIALAAHNLKFEQQWLGDTGDMLLICTYKVALRTWPEAPAHNNGALRYWLEDSGKIPDLGHYAMPPHGAGPDAYVTAHILKAAFDAGTTGPQMVAWSREPAVLPTCPIGEHRNKPWARVPFGFLEWMTRKAKDMDSELVWNAQRELDRRDRER